MAKVTDGECVVRVCEASDLEMLTSGGWQLKEVLQESAVVPLLHEEQGLLHVAEHARVGWSGNPERLSLSRSGIATLHRFLLRKSASTVVADAMDQVESMRVEVSTLKSDKKKLEQAQASAVENSKLAADLLESTRSHADRLRDELRASNGAKQKMERDLAAIRQDIGEGAMRRILGTPEAPAV